MSFLTDASLVFIPSGYKEDKAYSIKPTDGSGDLTFARASDGTRVNSEGYIERVPWNLLQQSNSFDTTWVNNGTTETGGQTGYDGTNEAWLLNKSIAGGSIRQSIVFNGVGTYSVYAKAGTLNYILLYVNYGTGTDTQAYFDLSSGSVGTTIAEIDANIESVGNGWYRCSVTFNTPTATASVLFFPANDDGDTSGTSGSIYIQDAQLNEGTLKPYFPTTNRQDVPRLDYSNGCPCLLLEPQRTNSVLYSEQFNNAYWGKGNASISANSTTSPDGTQNADSLLEQAVSGIHYVGKTVSAVAGSYTFSGFIKQNTRQYGGFRAIVNGFSNRYFVLLDLSNGSVVSTNTVGSGVTWSHSVESFANGWYRLSVSATHTSGNIDLSFSPSDSASPTYTAGFPNYTGDASKSIYIWGAQLEAGSYPTSYIPTTSAAVTRVADAAYKTGISSLIGQTEGTMFGEFFVSDIVTAGSYVRTLLNDGSSINQIAFFYYPDGRIQATSSVAGSLVVSINIPSYGLLSGKHKFAFSYKLNDYVLFIDGVNVGSDTSATVPSMSVFNLYDTSGGSMIYNQAALFKTRLTNDQLAALTTL